MESEFRSTSRREISSRISEKNGGVTEPDQHEVHSRHRVTLIGSGLQSRLCQSKATSARTEINSATSQASAREAISTTKAVTCLSMHIYQR